MVWELLEKVAGRVMTELAADLGAEVDFTGKSLLHGIMAGGKSACLVREAIQKKARIMSATEKLQSKARVAKLEDLPPSRRFAVYTNETSAAGERRYKML